MNRVIIAGGRDFNDEVFFLESMKSIDFQIDEVVSGTCSGVDKMGENYANENNIPISRFSPDWKRYKKAAGVIRNKEMAEYATHLIAFWDKKSKGTKSMIDLAEKYGLSVIVIAL
jgi:hypothetical protein